MGLKNCGTLSKMSERKLLNLTRKFYGQLICRICTITSIIIINYKLFTQLLISCVYRNQELVELISSAVRDLAESEFIGDRDEQNNPLPSKPISKSQREANENNGSNITDDHDEFISDDVLKPYDKERYMGDPAKEWEMRHILSAGSLLGKSCQGALKLAGLPDAIQRTGYSFGKHLSLAWQACLDLEPFQSAVLPLGTTFSLVSAPVLFHLDHDNQLYTEIEKGYVSIENVDYNRMHQEILNGPGIELTKKLQRKHSLAAMNVLNKFPPSDARTALQNIILAMQDL